MLNGLRYRPKWSLSRAPLLDHTYRATQAVGAVVIDDKWPRLSRTALIRKVQSRRKVDQTEGTQQEAASGSPAHERISLTVRMLAMEGAGEGLDMVWIRIRYGKERDMGWIWDEVGWDEMGMDMGWSGI